MKSLLIIAALVAAAYAVPVYYLTGSASDSVTSFFLGGPIIDLGGGSTDVDVAFQKSIDKVRRCTMCNTKIDIVILRASGADGYNDYLYEMNGVDSVETFVLNETADWNVDWIAHVVERAEMVFFAGGDQCDYVTMFKGSKLEYAVNFVYMRGGAIGGTSAGTAIMGSYIFDACVDGVTSAEALADPYNQYMTFTYHLFHFRFLDHVITDQHFVARNRLGRTLAFLARQIADHRTNYAWSIAVNAETSVVIDEHGKGTVMYNDGVHGVDPIPDASEDPVAYFILADKTPVKCVPGQPLSYTGYKVWKVVGNGHFDLAEKPTTHPDYYLDVVDGVVTSRGNQGEIY